MNTKRICALVLAACLTGSTFIGCGASTASSSSSAPASSNASEPSQAESVSSEVSPASSQEDLPPVEMIWAKNIGPLAIEVDDNAEVVKKIEERFNIDLKTWRVDNDTLNVRLAGGEMPDVLWCGPNGLPNYVEGGVLHEIPIDMIREKAPTYTKYSDENDDGTLWTTMIYNGKNYGITHAQEAVPFAIFYRKDWLDKLGLEVPETLDEFEKVMTAFVEDDPDGNGKKDTAGMAERTFGAIFGAYGLRCITGSNPGFTVGEMQLGEDNVPFFPYIRPEAKEVLTLLNKWYNAGIIDKEFITGENHGGYNWLSHSFMNGRIGTTSAMIRHYLTGSTDTSDPDNYGICMTEFKAVAPQGDIVMGKGPIGPTGKSGTEAWAKIGGTCGLTTNCFKDMRKVDAFFAMLDAYYSDMEYALMVNYGIEGRHFKYAANGDPVRIMEGTDVRKEGVLQVDFGSALPYATWSTPAKSKFQNEVAGNGYFRFNAPPTEEFSSVIDALDTMTEQAYFDIITGAKPIDYFDEYVENFKSAGGETAEKAVQKAFADLRAAAGK